MAALRKELSYMCAILAIAAGTAAHGQVASTQLASETVGFRSFQDQCLRTFAWGSDPDLAEMPVADVSQAEQQAISPHGEAFKYFLVSTEPRVILGRRWQEQRLGNNVVGVEGRCVVLAYETGWEGMAAAMEELTGISPRDTSAPERSIDGLMFVNIEALTANPRMVQPLGYGITRLTGTDQQLSGTTIYNAMI